MNDHHTHPLDRLMANPPPEPRPIIDTRCTECGADDARSPYAEPYGQEYRLCRECYDDTPEPDTGRPDWEDLQ